MMKIMKTNCQKIPVLIKGPEDVVKVMDTVASGKVCPIFTVSSCTGESIDCLRTFLSKLPKPQSTRICSLKLPIP